MEIGRNDPCPCGSGKKFKKCCLAKEEKRRLRSQQLSERVMQIRRSDFIGEPLRLCPACARNTFGVFVGPGGGSQYSRECKECGHRETYDLPPLKKNVVYLDQFLISNITKILDPESASHSATRADAFWETAYRKLTRLVRLQLVVCPDSFFHEEESLISTDPSFDSLRDIYEHFADGCTFYDYNTILRFQAQQRFEAWLDGAPPVEETISVDHIVFGDLNEWQGRIGISIDQRRRPEDAIEIRESRNASHEHLREVFDSWRESHKSFADSFDEEMRAFGRVTLKVFVDHLKKQVTVPVKYGQQYIQTGRIDVDLNDILPPPAADLVSDLIRLAEARGLNKLEALEKVAVYLKSEEVLQIPYVRLSSMLYASLARKAGAGQERYPSAGTFTDVNAIASLLPYCDAMFLDREMAALLREEPLRTEVARYGTRIFSLSDRDAFLTYLDEIEKKADPAHHAIIADAYGGGWLNASMELVVSRRRKRQQKAEQRGQ